jgi:hypothetical protein
VLQAVSTFCLLKYKILGTRNVNDFAGKELTEKKVVKTFLL